MGSAMLVAGPAESSPTTARIRDALKRATNSSNESNWSLVAAPPGSAGRPDDPAPDPPGSAPPLGLHEPTSGAAITSSVGNANHRPLLRSGDALGHAQANPQPGKRAWPDCHSDRPNCRRADIPHLGREPLDCRQHADRLLAAARPRVTPECASPSYNAITGLLRRGIDRQQPRVHHALSLRQARMSP